MATRLSLVERAKRCAIGKGKRFPSDNLDGDMAAACRWDCYRRATMLEPLAAHVFEQDVPGDFMEAGVFKGGIAIAMTAMLLANRPSPRTMWIADSFRGLPELDTSRIGDAQTAGFVSAETNKAKWYKGRFAIPERAVRLNFDRCLPGVSDENLVGSIVGFFNESLPGPVKQLALLRVDADMYTSITDVLERVYDLVAPGGFVVFDDYKFPQAQRAIEDFRARRGIAAPLQFYNATLDVMAYWEKTRA